MFQSEVFSDRKSPAPSPLCSARRGSPASAGRGWQPSRTSASDLIVRKGVRRATKVRAAASMVRTDRPDPRPTHHGGTARRRASATRVARGRKNRAEGVPTNPTGRRPRGRRDTDPGGIRQSHIGNQARFERKARFGSKEGGRIPPVHRGMTPAGHIPQVRPATMPAGRVHPFRHGGSPDLRNCAGRCKGWTSGSLASSVRWTY